MFSQYMSKHGVLDQDRDESITLNPDEDGLSPFRPIGGGLVSASNQNSINFHCMGSNGITQHEIGSFNPRLVDTNNNETKELGSFRPRMNYERPPEHMTWGASSFRPASLRKVKSRDELDTDMPHYAQDDYSYEPRPENRSRRIISWFKGKFVSNDDSDDHNDDNRLAGYFEEAMNNYQSSDHEDLSAASPVGTRSSPPKRLIESGGIDRSTVQLMPVIPESGPGGKNENVRPNKSEEPKKNWLEARKEYRAMKKDECYNVGPPTEKMMMVRDKIIKNKKLQICYKVFKSIPYSETNYGDDRYPVTPRRDMPCTQRIFREEVERWINQVKGCCSRPSSPKD